MVTPAGAKKRVEKVVPVDLTTETAPSDDTVKLIPFDGMPGESLLEVKTDDGVTLVFCDSVLNMPKLKFPMSVFLGPTGRISAPLAARVIALKDKRAFVAQLERLASTPGLNRLLFGHGKPITEDPGGALGRVVEQLRG